VSGTSTDYYCKPCAEGHYCDRITEIACTNHTDYSHGGIVTACTACPAKTECDIYNYIDCTEGFYIDETGSFDVCTACPAGKF
jgi:hypothetical protein